MTADFILQEFPYLPIFNCAVAIAALLISFINWKKNSKARVIEPVTLRMNRQINRRKTRFDIERENRKKNHDNADS